MYNPCVDIFFSTIIFLIVGYILYITWYWYVVKRLGSQTEYFSQKNKVAKTRLLIVGDSFTWGTGASQKEHSIAGVGGVGGVGGIHAISFARLGIGSFHLADLDGFVELWFDNQKVIGGNM